MWGRLGEGRCLFKRRLLIIFKSSEKDPVVGRVGSPGERSHVGDGRACRHKWMDRWMDGWMASLGE